VRNAASPAILAVSGFLLLAGSGIAAASAVDLTGGYPGRLTRLIRQSTVIAVAASETPEDYRRANLRLRLVRVLKGNPRAEVVEFRVFTKGNLYRTLHDAERALLFLKEGDDGKLIPTNRNSYIRLDGENAGLETEIEEYLRLQPNRYRTKAGRQAFREFAVEKIAASRSEYFRRNMVADLFVISSGVQPGFFTEQNTATLAEAALAETSFSVAAPLCDILDWLGSDRTDECILHALTDIPVTGESTSLRLAAVIAKRKALIQKLPARLGTMKDPRRIRQAVRHLQKLPEEDLRPCLRSLWQNSPPSRGTIRRLLGNRSASEEQRAFLRELEKLPPATKKPTRPPTPTPKVSPAPVSGPTAVNFGAIALVVVLAALGIFLFRRRRA